MTATEREGIRAAIDREVRTRLKGKRYSRSGDTQLRTGLWIPAIQKVQRQHVFSAISTEYGGMRD